MRRRRLLLCSGAWIGVCVYQILASSRSLCVASVKLGDTLAMLIWRETFNGILCCFVGITDTCIGVNWGMTAPLREKGILDMMGS